MGFLQNLFYNKSIRRLRQMLESVRMRDFSLQYSLKNLTGEERRMAEEINAVIQEFRESEHRRVNDSLLYDALLAKVDAILIAADENGHIRWMNRAAIENLCGFRFENIDHLASLHPSLPQQMKKLHSGKSTLISFQLSNGEERQYAATLSKIFVSGVGYRLYQLQSVAAILKQSEIMAQQRLIRILNHEIMNSLTPIVSLTETLSDSMRDPHGKGFTKEETRDALDAIFRRAKGLMHFVQRYRMLTGIAEPILKKTKLADLIKHIENWYASSQNDFTCQVCMPTECGQQILCIDLPQMEQVLINLVKNACETSATLVSIDAQLSEDERWMIISVTDNGGGFPESVRENLFTPFFTTKSEGQGIGLAVCRQIVSNHGGLIGAENHEEGAQFTIRLPLCE